MLSESKLVRRCAAAAYRGKGHTSLDFRSTSVRSEWSLDYEMPPLKIMQIRLAGLSRIDPTHGRRAALEIEIDGQCWELDETGEPPALGFAHLLKREDPDVILSEWGDSTILPLLRQQAERLKFSLNLNRDPAASVQQSKARSYTSYGRILFKASATSLFGRVHVDKQNSFISEKCDFAGLWELTRVTKLPIQYAAAGKIDRGQGCNAKYSCRTVTRPSYRWRGPPAAKSH